MPYKILEKKTMMNAGKKEVTRYMIMNMNSKEIVAVHKEKEKAEKQMEAMMAHEGNPERITAKVKIRQEEE